MIYLSIFYFLFYDTNFYNSDNILTNGSLSVRTELNKKSLQTNLRNA